MHLHGEDFTKWRNHLQYRFELGAYRFSKSLKRARRGFESPTLTELIAQIFHEEGEEGIREFYRTVCTFTKGKAALRQRGLIYKPYLGIDEKREDLFGEKKPHFHNLSLNNEGQIEGDVWHEGELIHICPSRSTLELALARNLEIEN